MSSDVIASHVTEQKARQEHRSGEADTPHSDLPDPHPPRLDRAPDQSTPCLQLKGSLLPMTVLELNRYDPTQLEQDLQAKVSQAPDFFENLPIVISLEKLREHEAPDFSVLLDLCQRFSIRIVAIRGGSEAQQQAARGAGLGILAAQKERGAPAPSAPAIEVRTETVEVVRTVVETVRQISKIVQHPIRSGQQVYAADGDLIILASVSAGAEILADANIHVYGALRGRALAGVKGDINARILCHSMEAELISIAGQYRINEDIDRNSLRKPMQVYLEQNTLKFSELEF
jgi:septum site-determining protein MinC